MIIENKGLTTQPFYNIIKRKGELKMNTYQINERTNLLIKLHSIMICMNDENAYMEWIVTVPDEPTREDFKDIAQNNKFFNEVLEEFMRIFNEYKDAE